MSRRRKKSNNNWIGILAIIIFIIYLLCGRTSNKTQELAVSNTHDALVFVVGNVKNSPAPSVINNDSIKNVVAEVFYNTESGKIPNISIISATSSPKTIDIDEKYLTSPAKNNIASNANLDTLMEGIDLAINTSPSNAGADYFEAINMAAEYVKNANNPLIIVIGSGLSDSGIINFAFNGILEKQAEDSNYISNLLSENSKVIENEYDNVTLIWYGCGQGVDEQPDLKEWKTVEKEIYEDALNYIGIKSTFNSITVSDSSTSVKTDYDVNVTTVDGVSSGYTLNLTERFVKFKADSSVITNITESKELLKTFADNLNKSDLKILITGYQTVCAKTETLGKSRAEAVKNLLIDLGIDESRIETKGVAGPPDEREESPKCGNTGVASEHRTVRIEVLNE